MVSDAGCGAAFARAALEGAVLNVRVNTKLMKDREYAANLDARVDELLAAGRRDADAVYAFVLDGLK